MIIRGTFQDEQMMKKIYNLSDQELEDSKKNGTYEALLRQAKNFQQTRKETTIPKSHNNRFQKTINQINQLLGEG